MSEVGENCRRVLDRIQQAAKRAARNPEDVQLIAVTKGVNADSIREALQSGIRHVGENRLQEALPKREALSKMEVPWPAWHFIGHLQTNKAKKVVESFDWIQSVDRLELAEKLNQSSTAALRRMPILIEVKLHDEPTKSGITERQLTRLVEALAEYRSLDLRGFMAVPPYFENPEQSRPFFRRLRDLGSRLGMTELSMGMSNDFEIAIEEGATMVRVGTAIFGSRPQ